ncbi:hypothetical protein R1sor_000630 [Riccia sorocarpa]|uniref:AB hydrolase-1 domain-containing protein n=1 Tax=Riccia sorocarpa TaxID=122646 RepID=A0ABD3GTQ3_9MARC
MAALLKMNSLPSQGLARPIVITSGSESSSKETVRMALGSSLLGNNLSLRRKCEVNQPQIQRSTRRSESSSIRMTLTEERSTLTQQAPGKGVSKALAYELVQGALVRWREVKDKSNPETPTAVLVHGILGGRRNFASFARRLAQEFPNWQFLLVDLRGHGESTSLQKRGPHTVEAAARDVLQLVAQLRLVPRILIGHSFGGKVVMSMADQAKKPLARPVRVWVLDATPGKVRAGGDDEDHPAELIEALRQFPPLVPSRRTVVDTLASKGFSPTIAQWMTTNLRPAENSDGFSWVFDLDVIADMYKSYENTNLWPMVEGVPVGVHIDFLRAERSLHRWHRDDVQRIRLAERIASREGAGVQMHVLEDAGHWVHADNPDGLFRILAPSFNNLKFTL